MLPLYVLLLGVAIPAAGLGSLELTYRHVRTGTEIVARQAANRTQVNILSGKTQSVAIADGIDTAARNFGIICPHGNLNAQYIQVTIDGNTITASAGPSLCRDPWTLLFARASASVTVPLPATGP